MLEKRPTKSKVQIVTELKDIVKKQDGLIAQLEARIQELETVVKVEEVIPVETAGYGPLSETNGVSDASKTTFSRNDTFQFSYKTRRHRK